MEVGLSPAILAQVCGKADLRKKLSFEILHEVGTVSRAGGLQCFLRGQWR